MARGNYAEAAAALRPLAERGNAPAMVKLGDLYLAGQGVERSDELALRMYRGASDRGNGDAHQRIGDLYTKGRGVPQNNFQAFAYYMAAVRAGNATAKSEADRVSATLQTVEVQQALKLAERIGRSKER
jgi:TPR repeat protein